MISLEDLSPQPVTSLYAGKSAIRAWQLRPFEAAPLNKSKDQSEADILSYWSRKPEVSAHGSEANNPSSSDKPKVTRASRNTLVIIPQEYSRGPLKLTRPAADVLSTCLDASPMFKDMISSFERDETDYYLGRAAADFSPTATPNAAGGDTERFEFYCLLPYVEKNGRKPENVEPDSCYYEVQQWSVRQQAFYHSFAASNPQNENTVLVYPASELWDRIKSKFTASAPHTRTKEGWQVMPNLVFESLTSNWATYIGCLHRAVEKIKTDASFTHFSRPDIGEVNTQSLRDGLDMMDRLSTASHVLGNVVSTLAAVRDEARRNKVIWQRGCGETDKEAFTHSIDSVIRKLDFERAQVRLIMTRLGGVVEMVRDLIHLRSTHTMERMTARTIMEARTMRIIALVTMCFLPPSFVASFLQMGFIDIGSGGGKLMIDAEPGLWFYFAIAIPLVLVILGGYLWWDWRSAHNAKANTVSLV